VVVVDEFHWVKRRVKMQPINTKASTTRPMAKARLRMDSRFMGLQMPFKTVSLSDGSRVVRVLIHNLHCGRYAFKGKTLASNMDNAPYIVKLNSNLPASKDGNFSTFFPLLFVFKSFGLLFIALWHFFNRQLSRYPLVF
jgi:hypothetical protein